MRILNPHALGAFACVLSAVVAQDVTTHPAPAKADSRQMPAILLSKDVLGMNVKTAASKDAETIGELEDLVLAPNGKVAFGVVSTGGFLGIGETRTAVPFEAFQWSTTGTEHEPLLVLTTTKEQLKMAPPFEAAKCPACLVDDGWRKETTAAFGAYPRDLEAPKPAEASTSVRQCSLASKLKGADVMGSDGKLGDVANVVIDSNSGTATYLIVSDRPIPWQVVSPTTEGRLIIAKSKAEFEAAPKLEKDAAARLHNEEFCRRVTEFYHAPGN